MSEFEDKLKRAIERGQDYSLAQAEIAKQKKMTEDDYRRRHTELRLAISDQIELDLKKVVDHLPGFEYETVYGKNGWGGAIARDDVSITTGSRNSLFSRLELTVKPFSQVHIVDLVGKGTVRNQEIFIRDFHKTIDDAEAEQFLSAVDQWVLEYVEAYSNTAN